MRLMMLGLGVALAAASFGDYKGLTVAADGSYLLEGRPFKGIGANYVCGLLFSGGDSVPVPETVFADARTAGIPVIRMLFSGYHPVDVAVSPAEKAALFAKLDRIVNAAEANNIGIIADIFFNTPAVPDRLHEAVGQWGNPDSQTRAYMRQLTTEIVTRYRNRRGIYGWEWSNEVNNFVDLPGDNGYTFLPTETSLGYPPTRTPADNMTDDGMRSAITEFAATVRAADPYHRLITSGHSLPRPSAWNLRDHRNWEVDTYSQFKEMLDYQNPSTDAVTGHAYTNTPGSPYYDDLPRVAWLKQASIELGRPAAVLEWGSNGPSNTSMGLFYQYLSAIETNNIGLSCLWVFEYPLQPDWTVGLTGDRSYQVTALTTANALLRSQTPDVTAQLTPTGSKPFPTQIDVSIRYPGSVNTLLTVVGDISPTGTLSVRLPSLGTYDISFKIGTYLRRTITVNASSGSTSLGSIALFDGDVNGDNQISLPDLVLVRRAAGAHPHEKRWNPTLDLNNDLLIDSHDQAVVSGNFGRFGDN